MTADEAAKRLVDWMNDDTVDIRERVKIAQDMLDRGGLGTTSKVMLGISMDVDPVENLFRSLLDDPDVFLDDAEPTAGLVQLPEPELASWDDIVDAEVVEADESPATEPEQEPGRKNPHRPPRHVTEALLERLIQTAPSPTTGAEGGRGASLG